MPSDISAIHLDALGGIAGDMFVAALLDALPELRGRVLADAAAVLPAGFRARLDETENGGLRAMRFGLEGAAHAHPADTGYPSLMKLIGAAPLAAGTADQAAGLLTVLATVEAKMHGVALDQVHFHELADWDSLLDVVAAGSIAAALGPVRWSVSSLPRGGGTVRTHHGPLPVPAPATAALLTGYDWHDDGVSGERVTPTGGAILRHLGATRADGSGRLSAVGVGCGTRTLPGMPNVLRALVFVETAPGRDSVVVLSFDVDDMTGEELAVAADRLRATAGVLDVSLAQRLGKKGRPMHEFRVLAQPAARESVAERCFLETSTIGLRIRREERIILPRVLARAAADGAEAGVKTVRRGNNVSAKAESDDLQGDTLEERRRLKRRIEEEAK